MKKLFLLLATMVYSLSLFAYPIEPQPLRKLVMESGFIVHGLVLNLGTVQVKKNNKNAGFRDREYADILVKKVLQGQIDCNTIRVYYNSGMICPASPVYIKGEEMIVFLDKQAESDGYYTHALSYGTKNGLGEEGIRLYSQRILEMQDILKINDTRLQEEKILDWLVTCAENKITRWEGTYELSPSSDFMSFYDRGDLLRKDIFLHSQQKNRLLNAISDTIDYFDLGLVDIVTGTNDAKLLALLKKALRATDKSLWEAEFFMERIVKFTGSLELDQLLEKFTDISPYEDKNTAERITLYEQFLNKMEALGLKQATAASGMSSS